MGRLGSLRQHPRLPPKRLYKLALILGCWLAASSAEAAWGTGNRWTTLLRGQPSPAARQRLHGGPFVIEDLLRGFVWGQSPTQETSPPSERPLQDRIPQERCQDLAHPRTRPPQILQWRISRGRRLTDTRTIGVPLSTPIEVSFSEPMRLSSVRAATSVWALMNHRGQTIRAAIPMDLRYDEPCGRLAIHPPSGRWPANHTLRLTITQAVSAPDGTPLTAPFTQTLATVLDPSQDNVVVADDGTTRLSLPVGSLTTFAYVLFRLDPAGLPERVNPAMLAQASQHLQQAVGPLSRPLLVREVTAYNTEGTPLGGLGQPGLLTVPYPDADGNGLVYGVTPPIRVTSLALWHLDEAQGVWVRLPDNHLDPVTRSITAPIQQWGAFALIAGPESSLANAFAFPVPWRPHAGNPRTGTEAEGVTFTNLTSECTIRIYTITGELVREFTHHSGLPSLRWDVTTDQGDPVASGVYLYDIRSSQDSKRGKLMIIR